MKAVASRFATPGLTRAGSLEGQPDLRSESLDLHLVGAVQVDTEVASEGKGECREDAVEMVGQDGRYPAIAIL
jgi:hypothetical protein